MIWFFENHPKKILTHQIPPWKIPPEKFPPRKLISVINEKRDKCLILMLKLKVSKQSEGEGSKNKVSNNQKSVKYITKLRKSK